VGRTLILFIALAAVWLMWSGMFVAMILGFGLASCMLVLWLCHRMGTIDDEGVPLHVLGRVLVYLPWFLKEIVTSNLDVVKRILGPRTGITPVVFDVPATQKTELGRAIFANSITLTPGTVSYVVEDDKIRVHAVAKEVRDALLTGEMDRRCTALEGND